LLVDILCEHNLQDVFIRRIGFEDIQNHTVPRRVANNAARDAPPECWHTPFHQNCA